MKTEANSKVEANTTRVGTQVHIKRARIKGVTADIVKHELRIVVAVAIDESSLAVRDDLAFWSFDETPVGIVLKPSRTQLGMQGFTLEPGERAVAEAENKGSDDEAS